MSRIRHAVIGLCALVLMSLSVSAVKADSFHITGTNGNGNPYDVTATISQSGSQLTVVLTNNISNQLAVDQSISGFQFHVVGFGGSGSSGFSGSGRLGTYDSGADLWNDNGGTSAADALSWGLSSPGAGSFKVLAPFPQETIAGIPTASAASTFNYNPAANASLQTGSHQPIVANSATFIFTVTGLPADAHFDGIVLFLGTGPEQINCASCVPTQTPEPASMFLLGTGLVGAAGGLRRRRNKK